MATLQSGKRLATVRINEQSITVEPRETVLLAALRNGIDFPNSCRVGGCGTCKCKLTSGKVKELTETGYLLSAEELDQGYVLACQSIPQGDVHVEVDLTSLSARGIPGRVVKQEPVTHDITRLTIQLDQPIPYKAGQFANLGIEGLSGVVRSYSFATPSNGVTARVCEPISSRRIRGTSRCTCATASSPWARFRPARRRPWCPCFDYRGEHCRSVKLKALP